MPMDAESLYRQLGRLMETMPNFYSGSAWSDDTHRWVGRADALICESGDIRDQTEWRAAINGIHSDHHAAATLMMTVLYRVLAAAELRAPASVKGTFIPVGHSFDAFAALAKVLQGATRDVLIVDPFMDETVLTEFGGTVSSGVTLRLLADQASQKQTLQPASAKWMAQYGATRPLQVRLAPPKALHDRAIFTDQTTAWTLTQSLKDFAKRSPAEIVRADDIAALKIAAYEAIWANAQIVV
jgi:fermentation-respiration switch protein FrsA (DUF1100 family)